MKFIGCNCVTGYVGGRDLGRPAQGPAFTESIEEQPPHPTPVPGFQRGAGRAHFQEEQGCEDAEKTVGEAEERAGVVAEGGEGCPWKGSSSHRGTGEQVLDVAVHTGGMASLPGQPHCQDFRGALLQPTPLSTVRGAPPPGASPGVCLGGLRTSLQES